MCAIGSLPSIPVTLLLMFEGRKVIDEDPMGTSRLDCCSRSSMFSAVKLGGQLVVGGTLSQTSPVAVSLLAETLPGIGAVVVPLPVKADCLLSTLNFSRHTSTDAPASACTLLQRPTNSRTAAICLIETIRLAHTSLQAVRRCC